MILRVYWHKLCCHRRPRSMSPYGVTKPQWIKRPRCHGWGWWLSTDNSLCPWWRRGRRRYIISLTVWTSLGLLPHCCWTRPCFDGSLCGREPMDGDNGCPIWVVLALLDGAQLLTAMTTCSFAQSDHFNVAFALWQHFPNMIYQHCLSDMHLHVDEILVWTWLSRVMAAPVIVISYAAEHSIILPMIICCCITNGCEYTKD